MNGVLMALIGCMVGCLLVMMLPFFSLETKLKALWLLWVCAFGGSAIAP